MSELTYKNYLIKSNRGSFIMNDIGHIDYFDFLITIFENYL